MKYETELVPGRLIRRYKRFLADVRLDDGGVVTAHCANTGSMLNCQPPDARVWLSPAQKPRRKLAWTWELVEVDAGVLVGIHTGRANALVEEAIRGGLIDSLQGYAELQREVPYGSERSRIDLLLDDASRGRCYVEVKSVTLGGGEGLGWFPDARTTRGQKHLRELVEMVDRGHRAVLCFCVQRGDVSAVRPAAHIDPDYAAELCRAQQAGVELMAWKARVSPQGIDLREAVPVRL